jgi:mono/diheme cytochrome c family protein
MWNKAPTMTAAMKKRGISVPQLRPEEMADIVAYLYSVRYFAEPGSKQAGLTVARDKGCLRCHGASAERAKGASDLGAKRLESPAAVIAALWNHPVIAPAGSAAAKAWPQLRRRMADVAALLRSVGWPRWRDTGGAVRARQCGT